MKNNKLTTMRKINIYVSNIWYKYFKKPFYYDLIVEPRKRREKKLNLQKYIREFEEKSGLDIARIKYLMFYDDNQKFPKLSYWNEKLIEGKKNINKFINKIPFFYEPEICDIHNENINLKNKSLDEIKKEDYNFSEFKLLHQKRNAYKSSPMTRDSITDKFYGR